VAHDSFWKARLSGDGRQGVCLAAVSFRASGFRLLESPWMDEARSPCTGPRSSGQAALGTEERPWGDLPTSRVTTGLDRGELVSLLTLVVVLAPFMTDVTLVSKVATAAIGLVSGEG
jgi:hypothetical protein